MLLPYSIDWYSIFSCRLDGINNLVCWHNITSGSFNNNNKMYIRKKNLWQLKTPIRWCIKKTFSEVALYIFSHCTIRKNYIKMSNNNFFLTMIVLTFTCISSRHLLFFSEATNLQRKVSLISQPTTTVSTPTPTQQSGNKTDKPKSLSSHLSMAAESGLTFISVFIFGCVIIASVYSWKKFSESSWG